LRLERVLGLLMLAGTTASLALMALGISLYFLQHGEEVSVSERWVVRSRSFLEFVASIGEGPSLARSSSSATRRSSRSSSSRRGASTGSSCNW